MRTIGLALLVLVGCGHATVPSRARCPADVSQSSGEPLSSDELRADRQSMKYALPRREQLPKLLDGMATIARNAGLTLDEIEPGDPGEWHLYAETPVGLRVRGTFRELTGFLRTLAERDRRMVNVRSLVVSRRALPVKRALERYHEQMKAEDPEFDLAFLSPLKRLMIRVRAYEEVIAQGVVLDATLSLAVPTFTGRDGAPPRQAATGKGGAAWGFFVGLDNDWSTGFARSTVGAMRDPFESRLVAFVPRISFDDDASDEYPPPPEFETGAPVPAGEAERFRAPDYVLTEIRGAEPDWKAVLVDPEGTAHVLAKGDRIGSNGGTIERIETCAIRIAEPNRSEPILLRLAPPEPPAPPKPPPPPTPRPRYDPPPIGPAAGGHADKVGHGICHPASRSRTTAALEAGRTSAVRALMYLSYVLRRVDAELPEAEYRALSDEWGLGADRGVWGNGAEEAWNPDAIWLTALSIHGGAVRVFGEARDHRDVAIFMHRLATAAVFGRVRLVRSQAGAESMGQPYVEFELTANLVEVP